MFIDMRELSKSTIPPVDVFFRVVRWIVLHNPIHCRYVKSARSYVSAKENGLVFFAELEEGRGPLLLLLLAVNVHHRNIDVIEELRVILD